MKESPSMKFLLDLLIDTIRSYVSVSIIHDELSYTCSFSKAIYVHSPLRIRFPILFSRTKTLLQGGSNVRTRVLRARPTLGVKDLGHGPGRTSADWGS